MKTYGLNLQDIYGTIWEIIPIWERNKTLKRIKEWMFGKKFKGLPLSTTLTLLENIRMEMEEQEKAMNRAEMQSRMRGR